MSDVLRDLFEAAHHRVTSHMLPLHTLHKVLSNAQSELRLTPIFPFDSLKYYYPSLEASLTPNCIYVHIPLKSDMGFSLWEVSPFPFFYNDSLFTLDLKDSVVLVSNDERWVDMITLVVFPQCRSSFGLLYARPAFMCSLQDAELRTCL